MKNIFLHLLIFTALITIINSAPPSCRYISQLTNEQVWSFYQFSTFQIYFTFVVGSIAVIILIAASISWVYNPNFQTPLDISFIIIIASLMDLTFLLIEVIYFSANQGQIQPDGFGSVCIGVGFFNMLGNSVVLYYNTFFCICLAYSINNTLKKQFLSNRTMHFLCLLATISAILIIIFTQNSGSPLSGICIYRIANRSSLGLFFLHILLLSLCVYSTLKFRSRIPKNSYFETKSHFKYYFSYLVFFSTCQGVNTLLYLIGTISCQSQSQNLYSLLDNIYAAINVISILQGLGIGLLRLSNPRFLQKMKEIFRKRQRSSIQIQLQQQQKWIDSLVQSIKGSEILSFIQAIMMNYIQHSTKYPEKLTPYHFQRQYSFIIDQIIAQDYVRRRITNRESHFNRQNSAGLKTLKFQVTIFTPQFYSWLFRNGKINLFKSFDVRKNLSLVKQNSFTEGGKSGQFFFATHDHHFIFKTITAEQSVICKQKTQKFYQYYQTHKDTLLIKILGLYTFKRKDIEYQPISLILMKNLTMNKRQLNLRVYDIKGSEFNRSTLRQKKIKTEDEESLRKYTLMDKDFLAIEGRINIDQQKAVELKHILIRDIKFLATLGVMDYSLLIIKRRGEPTHQLGEYQSTKQEGVFFNFGIIDYLQEWTLRKKAERIFKTLITNQEVTVNSPTNYSERLIEFIHSII